MRPASLGGIHRRRGFAEYEIGWLPLHAEPRAPDGFDGVGGPADFDLCRALTTEEIEQQLARKSSDANRGFPSPGSYGIGRPGPLKLKPCTA
jgi:hypothetical protein